MVDQLVVAVCPDPEVPRVMARDSLHEAIVGKLNKIRTVFKFNINSCYFSDSLERASVAVVVPLVDPQWVSLEHRGHVDQSLVQAEAAEVTASEHFR